VRSFHRIHAGGAATDHDQVVIHQILHIPKTRRLGSMRADDTSLPSD
jgi:predicted metallopeptidase